MFLLETSINGCMTVAHSLGAPSVWGKALGAAKSFAHNRIVRPAPPVKRDRNTGQHWACVRLLRPDCHPPERQDTEARRTRLLCVSVAGVGCARLGP